MEYKFCDLVPWRVFGKAVTLLIMQQIIVASSSIWLASFITAVQGLHDPLIWLAFYVASLLVPYLPGAASLIVLERAQTMLAINFVHRFQDKWTGCVLLWPNRKEHARTSSLLTGEASQALHAHLGYYYHMLSCTLNVLLNLVVIALIVDWTYLVSFAIGMVLAGILLLMQRNRKRLLALLAQQERIQWTAVLLGLWDNVLLGNRYNLQMWTRLFSERGQKLMLTAVGLERFSQMISVSLAFLLLTPTLCLVTILVIQHLHDPPFLGIVAITLPRLFQMLSCAYELLFLASGLPAQRSRIRTVLDALRPSQTTQETPSTFEKRLHWQQLQCSQTDDSLYELKSLFDSPPQHGRFTLRGPNGSGKTSVLLLLKQKYGDAAFFLPAHHTLLFEQANEHLSTGQRARTNFQELSNTVDASILLLDEWDANLDANAIQELSRQIDTISNSRCVIEARHRT